MIVSYRGLGAPRGGAGLGMRCRAVVAEGVAPPAGRARLEAVLVEALRPARQPRRAQWVPLRAPPGGRADERYVRRLRQRELRERLPRRPRAQPCRPRERRPVPGRTKQPSRSSSAKHAVAGDRERVDGETYMMGLSCIIGVAATSPARICWVTHCSIVILLGEWQCYKQDKPLDGGGGVHFCAAACTWSGLGPWIMVRSGDTAGAWRMACRTEFTLPPLVTTYTVQKSGAVLEMVLEISALNLHKPNQEGISLVVQRRPSLVRNTGRAGRVDIDKDGTIAHLTKPPLAVAPTTSFSMAACAANSTIDLATSWSSSTTSLHWICSQARVTSYTSRPLKYFRGSRTYVFLGAEAAEREEEVLHLRVRRLLVPGGVLHPPCTHAAVRNTEVAADEKN